MAAATDLKSVGVILRVGSTPSRPTLDYGKKCKRMDENMLLPSVCISRLDAIYFFRRRDVVRRLGLARASLRCAWLCSASHSTAPGVTRQ
jgi:hypothetical protein